MYNVPLAAAVFALETLLLSWSRERLLAALLACGTAVLVVRTALGDVIQYPLSDFPLPDEWFNAWALAAAPLSGQGARTGIFFVLAAAFLFGSRCLDFVSSHCR